jgi:hypothetical protein
VPRPSNRLRNKGIKNTVYTYGLPCDAFLDLGSGLYVSSPELLFVELSSVMSFEVHLLLAWSYAAPSPATPKSREKAALSTTFLP